MRSQCIDAASIGRSLNMCDPTGLCGQTPPSPALHIERRRAISARLQTQVWAEICRLCSGWDVDSEMTDTFAAVAVSAWFEAAGIVHDTSLLWPSINPHKAGKQARRVHEVKRGKAAYSTVLL